MSKFVRLSYAAFACMLVRRVGDLMYKFAEYDA